MFAKKKKIEKHVYPICVVELYNFFFKLVRKKNSKKNMKKIFWLRILFNIMSCFNNPQQILNQKKTKKS